MLTKKTKLEIVIEEELEEFLAMWTHYFFSKVFSETEMKEALREMLEEWDIWRSNV